MRRALVAVLLLVAACQRTELKTQPPDISDEELPLPEAAIKESYVSSPIVFDLRPLLEELEVTVPRLMGSVDKNRRIKVMGTPSVSVAPELHRAPFNFAFEGNTVTVTTMIEYRAQAWATLFNVSCGMKDPKPRMRVKIAITYDLTSNWHLKTHSRVLELEPVSREERDQCEISAMKIDVTPKIASAARGAVDGQLQKLDRKLAGVSVRKPVEKIWIEIQKPISLSKGTLWLDIGPKAIALGPITATDSTLVARLDLLASPQIYGGERPAMDTLALPPLGHTKSTIDTADVHMNGLLTWGAADKILGKELVGKTIGKRLHKVRIDSIAASSAGKGRLVLATKVSGAAHGILYVIGTPTYDSTTDLITIPDLALDVNSSGPLGEAAAWLLNGPFVEEVRSMSKIPAARLMDEVVGIANKEINRRLTEGVELRGQLSGAQVRSVHVAKDGLHAVGHGSGRLWLEISKDDLLPDRKAKSAPKAAGKDASKDEPKAAPKDAKKS